MLNSKIYLCFYLILLSSCTHKKVEDQYLISSSLEEDSCLNELTTAKRMPIDKVFDVAVNGTQTGVSYLLTGAGYTTDFVVVTLGGIGIGIAVCSPIIAIEGTLRGSGHISGECISNVSQSVFRDVPDEGLGSSLYDSTESLRCPEVDYISEGLRKVVACYESRGQEDLAKAQARKITNDPLLKTCSSDAEKRKVEKLLIQPAGST